MRTEKHGVTEEISPELLESVQAKDGNFQRRIAEHYLFDETKMNFGTYKPAPRERSIFRKNIGRALLKAIFMIVEHFWEGRNRVPKPATL
jgi:hypothetical protein